MKQSLSAKRIAILGIFSALAYVGRMLFSFIPNVQPVSSILIIITFTMGSFDGIIVAILSMLLSNIFLGMGPWTLTQIGTYTIIILLTGWVVRPFYIKNSHTNRIIMAMYAGFTGLLYGFIISIFTVTLIQSRAFWPYYLRGIPFDLAHAIGNVAFYLILEPILTPIIDRNPIK